MHDLRGTAFSLLCAAIATAGLGQNAWAEDSSRAHKVTTAQIKYGLIAKLSESSKIFQAPALLDLPKKNEVTTLALAGLKKLELVVEELNEDAGKCGFVADRLEQVVRDTLSPTEINLVYKYSPEANATIYLSVNSLADCTTNYTIGIFTRVTIRDSGNSSYARVWWAENLRTGGSNPAADLEEQIVEGSKMLVSDWKLANE